MKERLSWIFQHDVTFLSPFAVSSNIPCSMLTGLNFSKNFTSNTEYVLTGNIHTFTLQLKSTFLKQFPYKDSMNIVSQFNNVLYFNTQHCLSVAIKKYNISPCIFLYALWPANHSECQPHAVLVEHFHMEWKALVLTGLIPARGNSCKLFYFLPSLTCIL